MFESWEKINEEKKNISHFLIHFQKWKKKKVAIFYLKLMAHLVIAKVLKHPILFIRQYLETQRNVTVTAFVLDIRK